MIMKLPSKKDFYEATRLRNTWNKAIEWNGYTIGTVLWQSNPWKLADAGTSWEDLKTSSNLMGEFHTQQDLWEYVQAKGVC